jgi:hypothetical protein
MSSSDRDPRAACASASRVPLTNGRVVVCHRVTLSQAPSQAGPLFGEHAADRLHSGAVPGHRPKRIRQVITRKS